MYQSTVLIMSIVQIQDQWVQSNINQNVIDQADLIKSFKTDKITQCFESLNSILKSLDDDDAVCSGLDPISTNAFSDLSVLVSYVWPNWQLLICSCCCGIQPLGRLNQLHP